MMARVMKSRVVFRFTHAQTLALCRLIGNTSGFDDAMESVFQDGRERATAYRVAEIVQAAAGAVQREKQKEGA